MPSRRDNGAVTAIFANNKIEATKGMAMDAVEMIAGRSFSKVSNLFVVVEVLWCVG